MWSKIGGMAHPATVFELYFLGHNNDRSDHVFLQNGKAIRVFE